jgi:transcriptional regulator with XRE-family HTH domain
MRLRIRELREARGLSQADLAKLIGTTGVSVGRYEKEPGRVTMPLLDEIARALNCRVADLLGDGQIIEQPVVVLPFLGGKKRMAFDGDQVDKIGKASTLQAIEVDDDAMMPTLAKGDIVLIDKTVAKVTQDGVYAIEASGHTMVKRVSFNPIRKKLTITNDNALYAPLGDVAPSDIKVAGRVVWAGKRL